MESHKATSDLKLRLERVMAGYPVVGDLDTAMDRGPSRA